MVVEKKDRAIIRNSSIVCFFVFIMLVAYNLRYGILLGLNSGINITSLEILFGVLFIWAEILRAKTAIINQIISVRGE